MVTELDNIIGIINAYDPGFSSKLHKKYFENGLASTCPYFTKEEMEFISNCGKITMAMIPDTRPIVYANEEFIPNGIIPDILNIISEMCDIEFEYVFIPKDHTPLSFMQENPTYILGGIMGDNPAFHSPDLLLSDVFFGTHSALFTRKNRLKSLDLTDGSYTIGMPTSFQSMHLYIQNNYPNLTIVDFLSVEKGLKALENGSIDYYAYIYDNIVPLLSNPQYSDIITVNKDFLLHDLRLASYNNPNNNMLFSIINKCISLISESTVSKIEVDHVQNSFYHFDQDDYFSRYQNVILIIVLIIVLIITTLISIQLVHQKRYNKEITIHAEYDLMTGLYNRKTFNKKVLQVMEHNTNLRYAIIVINIDDLNQINDIKGHNAGDEAIKEVANVLRSQFSNSFCIGRLGGDEFGVFLAGGKSRAILVSLLVNLQKEIAYRTIVDGTMDIRVSIGVATGNTDKDDIDVSYAHADEAMRSVKKSGKNGFAFYESRTTLSMQETVRKKNGEYIFKDNNPVNKIEEINQNLKIEENSDNVYMDFDSNYRNLIESFPNVALYVIEEVTHKILYFNKYFRTICPNVSLGMNCRNMMFGLCQNCIVDEMGEKATTTNVFYNDFYGDEIDITATKVKWEKKIPAVMICMLPKNTMFSSNDKNQNVNAKQEMLDFTTGGFTRNGFIYMVEKMRKGGVDLTQYAILFTNIQNFKAVNEMTGSEGGDNLLHTLYSRIELSSFYPVIGARAEADHFVFLVEKKLLDFSKFQDLLNIHWSYKEFNMFIHSRCGILMIDDNDLEIYKMIDRAKLAKEHIVDDYVKPYEIFVPNMLDEYSEKAEALLLFDKGIKNNEFLIYYQPVIDAKSQKIVSAEALVRKKMEDGTIMSPGKFIPILERTGYISLLDRYVSETVNAFQNKQEKSNYPIIPISINISQKDFYDNDFMDNLISNYESGKMNKNSILLEITESDYALGEKDHDELIKKLRSAGAKILLDDFGSGYSSFGMFKDYYFDRVKLDMSFVRQLENNQNVRKVVKSIISMCHDLGVQVLAEGVENEREFIILRDMDCDFIQGYYFSKPLDEVSFIQYMKEHI